MLAKRANRFEAAPSAYPPEPQSIEGDFHCRAMGGARVGYALCTEITINANRSRKCGGCESPWRICFACASQCAVSAGMRAPNPRSGLCAFHEAHGVHAVPPPGPSTGAEVASIRRRTLGIVPRDPLPEPDEEPDEDAQEERAVPVVPVRAASVPSSIVAPHIGPEQMAYLAAQAKVALAQTHRDIMRCFFEGMEPSAVAAALRITLGQVHYRANEAVSILKVDIAGIERSQRRPYLRELLRRVYALG